MSSRYELITYRRSEQSLLDNAELSDLDIKNIKDISKESGRKILRSRHKDIYIFCKYGYSSSQLAEIYNISLRQMQRIIKEMELTSRLPKRKLLSKRRKNLNLP